MFKYLKVFIITAIFAAFVSACSSRAPVTSGVGTNTIAVGQNFQQYLKLDNDELASILAITDVKTRKNNGLLEVNLTITSASDKSQQLQYQFNWFDAQGFAVEARKSPWKSVELHGMQNADLRGLAPTETAVSFNIYVRNVPAKAYEY